MHSTPSVGNTRASSTISNLTCKRQATKPLEEETKLSTMSSVRPGDRRRASKEAGRPGQVGKLPLGVNDFNEATESASSAQVDEAGFASWGGPFCGECGSKLVDASSVASSKLSNLTCKRQAAEQVGEEMMQSTPSTTTSAMSTISNPTCKRQATKPTKPLEEETMLSTPSSVRPVWICPDCHGL